MLQIVNVKNQKTTREIAVKTNDGSFIIQKGMFFDKKDNVTLDLFIGTFENKGELECINGEPNTYKEYIITDEDYYIYSAFVDLVKDLSEDDNQTEYILMSEDDEYSDEEKSYVRFIIDFERKQVVVRFVKSKSKSRFNSYIVKKSCVDFTLTDPRNKYIDEFFNKLCSYEATNNQINIEEYIEDGTSRVRCTGGKVNK